MRRGGLASGAFGGGGGGIQQQRGGGAGNAARSATAMLERGLVAAAGSGSLALVSLGLEQIPGIVWAFGRVPVGGSDSKWWEVVPLRKMDLSHNALQSVDRPSDVPKINLEPGETEWEAWKDLSTLLLAHNVIRALPPAYAMLGMLTTVDISYNQFEVFPDVLTQLPGLETLNISHNKIVSLPDTISQWQNLRKFDCSHNQLQYLPVGILHCSKLEIVAASNNRISWVPPQWGNLPRLNDLDLEHNLLVCQPPQNGPLDIRGLPAIRRLGLRYNQLVTVPIFSDQTNPALTELLLAFNNISTIPDNALSSSVLALLDLKDNKISSFPERIDLHCPNLNTLDLSNNNISVLTPYLSLCSRLTRLTIVGNPLRSLRPDLHSKGADAILKYLKTRLPEDVLHSSENAAAPANARYNNGPIGSSAGASGSGSGGGMSVGNSSAVPSRSSGSVAGGAPAARGISSSTRNAQNDPILIALCGSAPGVLDLRDKGFKQLPMEGWEHVPPGPPGLKDLLLDGNPLSGLPEQVPPPCSSLQRISLARTALASAGGWAFVWFPSWSSLCSRLTSINLRDCRLTAFPNGIHLFQSLKSLELSGNEIPSLPDSTQYYPPNLEELDVSRNRLQSLGAGVWGLKDSLRQIIAGENKITDLPRHNVRHMKRLEVLKLENNDLSAIPDELGYLPLRVIELHGNRIRPALISRGSAGILTYCKMRLGVE